MLSEEIKSGLNKYKKKLYLRRLSKGVLLTLSFFIFLFVLINSLEDFFWFDQNIRLLLFLSLVVAFLIPFSYMVLVPIFELMKIKRGISEYQIAKDIGNYFPEIKDRLLNLLELNDLITTNESLVLASIKQKEANLTIINFSDAIDLRANLKYLYWFASAIIVLLIVAMIRPQAISDSSQRIINFNKGYERPAPFAFVLENENLTAFRNEDLTLNFSIVGEQTPESVYLVLDNNRRISVRPSDSSLYAYTFTNLQTSLSFQLEGASYYSKKYTISILQRPEIDGFNLVLSYPAHTQMQAETLQNIGSAIVPEGTKISWRLKTRETSEAFIKIDSTINSFQSSDNQSYTFDKTVNKPFKYDLIISNKHGKNLRPISYNIDVITDQHPKIEVSYRQDSILFSSVLIYGSISDDYGFKSLTLYQNYSSQNSLKKTALKFDQRATQQNFMFEWSPEMSLMNGETNSVELWVGISDNDRVNGSKETLSEKFYFNPLVEEEIDQMLDKGSEQAQNKIQQAEKKAESLNEKIQKLEDRLISKKELGWQEEKQIKEIINQKEEIQKAIEQLQQKHKELMASQKQFDKQSENLQEKSKELQKLMNELLDDETKKLYEELKKLLDEKKGLDEVSEQLSKIKPNEKSLEKELERALELFKKLKMETQLENLTKDLEELSKKQQDLADNKSNTEDKNREEQEQIKEEFEKLTEDLEKIEELNKELDNPAPLDDLDEEEQEIDKDLEELSEEMDNKQSKRTKQKQKDTGNKMQKMAQKMSAMQGDMEMEAMEENMEHLQDILDNLIKASFEQERIISDFKSVSQTDPRFLKLSQDQLTLVENTKVIEDSLLALASRVAQISNFVTREINQINRSLDLSLDAIKEREKGKASTHQQFAMTSMNNLALLLDDVLQQMQMAMSEGMGKPGKGKKSKPGSSMSELQKQLSQQIKDLKGSGQSGRKLSEELARLAAEQANIRKEMEALQKSLEGQKMDGGEGGTEGLKEAIEKMLQNEEDLVNKRLSQNLINRQQDIISRMLESEKSEREQEQDPKRESKTAEELERSMPPAFEQYLKTRKKEIELLNAIPLDLNPFYKKEVNEYFRRLSTQD